MKLPIQFEFQDKKILVIGAGVSTYRHVEKLVSFSGKITIVSKAFHQRYSMLENVNKIEKILHHVDLEKDVFANMYIVIIATSNKYLNKKIHQYCESNHILNMTIDNSMPSDFSFMESFTEKVIMLYCRQNVIIVENN